MSELSAHLERLKRQARGLAARVRPRHLVMAATVAVVAVGVAGVRAVDLPGPRPVLAGERLQIQVVAPVEPDVAPGSVMDVGDLVDGFEYKPPQPPGIEPAAYETYDETFEAPDPRPAPKRGEVVPYAPPEPEPPGRDWRDSRAAHWLGFDPPERDYRAEREVRRARREARAEREYEGRSVQWYRSDGRPDDRPDSRRGEPLEGPPPDRPY